MDQLDKNNLSRPTPSRTLRILASSYDVSKYPNFNYTLNGNVYFLTFDKLDDAMNAYNKLKDDKIQVRYHVYSLFTKFDEVMNTDQLDKEVKKILNSDHNITYLRVDNKDNSGQSHTGKVVVDKLDDCKTLLAFKDESSMRLRFYRFDPKKAIKKSKESSYKKKPNKQK